MRGYLIALALLAFVSLSWALSPPASDEPNAVTFVFNGTGTNQGVGRNNCTIMLCNEEAGWLGGWLNYWVDLLWNYAFSSHFSESTLYQSKCRFEHMTPKEIEEMIDDYGGTFLDGGANAVLPSQVPAGTDYIRSFMFGQGSTFTEFEEANAYCDSNMTILAKWMEWDPTNPTEPPSVGETAWESALQRSRATCYLTANVMPVYIFYTNSTPLAMDPLNIERFTQNFKEDGDEIGPVVICPEFEYNLAKDPQVRVNLMNSIRRIRANCEKCLIMLAPPEGDMASLVDILNDPANNYEMNRTVDIVGQSWTLNKDPCRYDLSLNHTIAFSREVLQRYRKPTLWILRVSNSSNFDNTCNWTASKVANAFTQIYGGSPGLVGVGGIGIINYQLLDGIDAMHNCTGDSCSLGLLATDESKKQPQFNRWFSKCRGYYAYDLDSEGRIENMTRVPIVFNYFGDNGTECNVLPNLGPFKLFPQSTTPEPTGPDLVKEGQTYSCGFCFGNITRIESGDMTLSIYYPLAPWAPTFPEVTMPSTWYVPVTEIVDDMHLAMAWHPVDEDAQCDLYDLSIRKHAEADCPWEIDAFFLRSVTKLDSNYIRCTVTYTRQSDRTCNVNNVIDPPITDPDGVCPPTRTDLRWDPDNNACVPSTNPAWERCKPCTFGVTNCNNTPFRWGTAPYSFPVPPYSGSEPYGCGPEFNPYDLQMGLCCGANSICASFKTAIEWVKNKPGARQELLLSPNFDVNWPYLERDKWTLMLLTLEIYHARGSTSPLDAYYQDWQETKWCPNSVAPHYYLYIDPTTGGVTEVKLAPTGPNQTFIWTYCNAYNDSANGDGTTGIFWGSTTETPLQQCQRMSISDDACHIGCAGYPGAGLGFYQTSNGRLVDPITIITTNEQSIAPFDLDMLGGLPGLQMCLNDERCVSTTTYIDTSGNIKVGGYCPVRYVSDNPGTYLCNDPANKYCCGGSFFEHLCCMDPYPCQVLYEYNKTVNSCPQGKICNRFNINGLP